MKSTKSCPACGGDTDAITDVYSGSPEGLSNFDEARDRLVVEDVECVVHENGGSIPLADATARDGVTRDSITARDDVRVEARTRVLGHDDDLGNDSLDGVVVTERWCERCDWSERLA